MKILILIEWYYPIGGVEAFVWNLIQHFNPEIKVILAVRFFNQKTILLAPAPNIEIVDVTGQTFWRIQKLVKKEQPDVIHSNHVSRIGFAGLFAAKTQHIPYVITNHQVPEYRVRSLARIFNPFMWLWYLFFDQVASAITVPSPTVAHLLARHGLRNKVHIFSCGVDINRFQPQETKLARAMLGLANTPTILFVGRLAKEKNLDLLLQAVAQLKDAYKFQVVLVGPTITRNAVSVEIERLITQLKLTNLIKWIGFLPTNSPQLAQYYAAADIFVLPSFFETQSIVTLEAMASCLAVIASNSGALPDLVEPGVNGYLFEPLNSDDLAQKIQALLIDPTLATRFGQAGRQKVMRHDIAIVAGQYQRLYETLRKHPLH